MMGGVICGGLTARGRGGHALRQEASMDRAALERLARERLADIPLPAEDWPALVPLIEQFLAVVAELGQLALEGAEPGPTYRVTSGAPR